MSPVRGVGGKSRAVTVAITSALGGQTDMQVTLNSLAPYAAQKIGERYATAKEAADKGGESLLTTAAGYGAGKLIEPLVVVVSKSGVWPKISSVFKGSTDIPVNPQTGLKESSPSSTPLNSHEKLNQSDQGKLKPAEAATGAQLESVLGPMEKYSGAMIDKNPDWVIKSGPYKGKTVDAMYTTDKLTKKEIDGLNKFYEKGMTVVDTKTGKFQVLKISRSI